MLKVNRKMFLNKHKCVTKNKMLLLFTKICKLWENGNMYGMLYTKKTTNRRVLGVKYYVGE